MKATIIGLGIVLFGLLSLCHSAIAADATCYGQHNITGQKMMWPCKLMNRPDWSYYFAPTGPAVPFVSKTADLTTPGATDAQASIKAIEQSGGELNGEVYSPSSGIGGIDSTSAQSSAL